MSHFRHTQICTLKLDSTHLRPGVHGFIPPVADPSPATDTGVPLLVFVVRSREVDCVAPPLQAWMWIWKEAEDPKRWKRRKTITSHSPLSLWVRPQSFHPRTSGFPIPNCWRGAGSCPGVDAAARWHHSTATGHLATIALRNHQQDSIAGRNKHRWQHLMFVFCDESNVNVKKNVDKMGLVELLHEDFVTDRRTTQQLVFLLCKNKG